MVDNCLASVIAMEHGQRLTEESPIHGLMEQFALGIGALKSRLRQGRFKFDLCARDRARCRSRAKELLCRPQAPQGTAAWFAHRRGAAGDDGVFKGGLLTASDTGTVLGLNEYACEEEVLLKKAGVDTFTWSPACEHGTKYEDITIAIYKARTGVEGNEYGCVDHDRISWLGASPDWITVHGTAVEIKNPFSRKPNGHPKAVYYAQIQQQLEVLDLEHCDFVETVIREYTSPTEYARDCPDDEPEAPWTRSGDEKGVLIEIETPLLPSVVSKDDDGENAAAADGARRARMRYIYAPLGLGPTAATEWVNNNLERIGPPPAGGNIYVRYWRCDLYSNVRVIRDRVWWKAQMPKLEAFWNRVEEVRRDPIKLEAARKCYEKFKAAKEARFGNKQKRTGSKCLRVPMNGGKAKIIEKEYLAQAHAKAIEALFSDDEGIVS